MKFNPYSTYRGRKSWLRRILIAIVIVLVIALIAAVIGGFVLQNYVEYTPNGPQLVIPFFGGNKPNPAPSQAVRPSSGATPDPDDVIFDDPSPSPSPATAALPIPDSLPPRRDVPLGLVGYEWPRLLDGSAKESLAANRGAIFSTEGADFTEAGLGVQTAQDLPYAVALVLYDPSRGEEVIATCQNLVGLGFDELVLQLDSGVTTTEAAQAQFYIDLRAAMDILGFNGRLSVVCTKATFTKGVDENGQSGQAVADNFERVYVPGGNWNGFNLYKALKDMGFTGTTADIVTTVTKPISANYSWAILP